MAMLATVIHQDASHDVDETVAQLFQDHRSALIGFAQKLTRSHGAAEDIVQDVFVDVLRTLRRDPGYIQGPARPLLFAMLVHRMAKLRRSAASEQRKRVRAAAQIGPPNVAPPALPVDTVLVDALRQLPPRMAETVRLCYARDLRGAQTAAIMGCGEATVHTQLRCARPRLRGLLTAPPQDRSAHERRLLQHHARDGGRSARLRSQNAVLSTTARNGITRPSQTNTTPPTQQPREPETALSTAGERCAC
jgi:RNA polymerase sigma factor (sigma-70 family)